MDASGSMNAGAGGGATKIEAARAAVGQVIDEVEGGDRIGLRLFGGGSAQQQGCTDSTRLFGVGPVDPEVMKATLGGYVPAGGTPIGYALRRAAADLPNEGTRAIVLVSDGKDSCAPPDPCAVAAQIAAGGVELRIETIGLRVSPAARDQLECIAGAGGGTYRDAANARELAAELSAISARATRGYEPVGEPIEGGPTLSEATPIEPGQYVDPMRPGELRTYSIELEQGETLTAASTLIPALPREIGASGGSSLEIGIFSPGGGVEPVAGSAEFNLFGEDAGVESVGAFGLPVGSVAAAGGDFAEEGTYLIGVAFTDNNPKDLTKQSRGRPFPMELLVNVIGGEEEEEEVEEIEEIEATETVADDPATELDPAGDESSGVDTWAVIAAPAGMLLVGFVVGLGLSRRRRPGAAR